jgi:hypothetical protein
MAANETWRGLHQLVEELNNNGISKSSIENVGFHVTLLGIPKDSRFLVIAFVVVLIVLLPSRDCQWLQNLGPMKGIGFSIVSKSNSGLIPGPFNVFHFGYEQGSLTDTAFCSCPIVQRKSLSSAFRELHTVPVSTEQSI